MKATPDPTAAEASRLRAALDLLDERPSPGVRARVMRAAAEAHGRRTAKAVPELNMRPVRRWFEFRPMAAAGATVVAILAVGVALHVEREERVQMPSETPAVATPPPVTVPSLPPSAGATAGSTAGAAAAPSAKKKAFALPRSRIEEAKPSPALEAPAETPATMQAPAPRAAVPQAAQRSMAPAADSMTSSAAGRARLESAPFAAKPSGAPDDWLRRIIALRQAGKDAQADEELARFRAAFPDVKVPDEALK